MVPLVMGTNNKKRLNQYLAEVHIILAFFDKLDVSEIQTIVWCQKYRLFILRHMFCNSLNDHSILNWHFFWNFGIQFDYSVIHSLVASSPVILWCVLKVTSFIAIVTRLKHSQPSHVDLRNGVSSSVRLKEEVLWETGIWRWRAWWSLIKTFIAISSHFTYIVNHYNVNIMTHFLVISHCARLMPEP